MTTPSVKGPLASIPAMPKLLRSILLAVTLAGGVTGCGELDPDQLRVCERLIPALEADGAQIEIVRAVADTAAANAVRIEYRTIGAARLTFTSCEEASTSAPPPCGTMGSGEV